MRTRLFLLGFLCLFLVNASPGHAQDRDTKVRNDRDAFQESLDWIYNDLGKGIAAAKAEGKPLMVVFRCIPCKACQKFDDDVARRDPIIRNLLDRFVCARIVQANNIDLTRFQYDFDQSFAIVLMNPDGTIYGRYGTRSDRPEYEDISLEGLRQAMEAALRMHGDYETFRPMLAGKQVHQDRYKTPRDFPSLSGRFGTALDYEGQVAKSCMHCHQVREAERLVYRDAGKPIPDKVLYPYPDPEVLGLKLDPKAKVKIDRVTPGSPADEAGLRVGDEIETLDGQPLLSIADLQWVLHNAPPSAHLPAQVRRGDEKRHVILNLPDGWRRANISWRVTTWDLRRMAFGGMVLKELTDAQRTEAKIPEDSMALKIMHVGQYGKHAVAKRAGFQSGDIIISYDRHKERMSESQVLAYALQHKRSGDEVAVTVLRNGEEKVLKFALQ